MIIDQRRQHSETLAERDTTQSRLARPSPRDTTSFDVRSICDLADARTSRFATLERRRLLDCAT
eukprot:488366-Prymnesium_polylepis.1